MTSRFGGYMGEALWVDLTKRTTRPFEISDRDRELFMGNKGLAAKILWDNLAPGTDPLGEENLLVVTTSPITGTGAPCSSRFNVSTKSPLTGGIASSNSGGNFGISLKKAGYDALILAGKADRPVYLEVNEDGVKINEAGDLWGLDTEVLQEELEKRHKGCGMLVIGPGGENLVRYAAIISGERACARAGVGTVMGSKLVKAVVAYGKKKPQLHNQEKFKQAIQSWIKFLRGHPVTGGTLPAYGTAGLMGKANVMGVLPTRNFSSGSFEGTSEVDGEALAAKYLKKNSGCVSCPIKCGRVIEMKGKEIKGPEYETIGMFGPNIGNRDLWAICEWNYLLDKLGLDTITTGNTIAFATELTERGLLKSDLAWGKTKGLDKLIEQIAYRQGLGDALAEGTLRMAEKFGGREYAINSKGLEIAAYEPRRSVGMGLGYATANRGGCHLNAGYMVYFENLGPVNIDPQSIVGKADLTIFQQNVFEAVSACGSCIFTTYAVIPGVAGKVSPYGKAAQVLDVALRYSGGLVSALFKLPASMMPIQLPMIPHSNVVAQATGMHMTAGAFLAAGNRAYNLERMFNVREGLVENSLPDRLTREPQIPQRPETKVPLNELLPRYYKARGWDSRGIPTVKTLKFLDLEFTTPALPPSQQSAEELQSAFVRRRQAQDQGHAKLIDDRKKASRPRGAKKK